MRKLRTFYGKVTEFLNDDKIPCLQRLRINARIGLYRRAEQTVYLYSMIGYLCKSLSGCGMHISSIELSYLDILSLHIPDEPKLLPFLYKTKMNISAKSRNQLAVFTIHGKRLRCYFLLLPNGA